MYLPGFSRLWWLLALALLLLLFSLLASPSVWGQGTEPALREQRPTLHDIETNLLSLAATSDLLKEALQRQAADLMMSAKLLASLKQQLSDSQADIVILQAQLISSRESADGSLKEIVKLSDLLTKSQTSLDALSLSFDNYRSGRESDMKELRGERLIWAILAGAAGLAVGAGIVLLFR